MPVDGLRLSDVVANAKEGLRAFNTAGLELHNVRINPDGGVPFLIRDSTGLDLDGVQTRNPKPGVPVVRLDSSKGASLRNSIAWPGTEVFLSMAPGTKVFLGANDFTAAGSASKEEVADHWKGIKTPDRPQGTDR